MEMEGVSRRIHLHSDEGAYPKEKEMLIPFMARMTIIHGGVCAYLLCIPFHTNLPWDVPLIGLALIACYAVFTRETKQPVITSHTLLILVLAFLLTTILSIIFSRNVFQSLRFTMFLLPATLIFFLIGEHFHFPAGTHLVYCTLSIIGLGLAAALLLTPWQHPEFETLNPINMARAMGSPLIIVANDLIFLSLLAPFSAAVFFKAYSSPSGMVAAISIILSISAVVMYQSRGALLTMVVSLVTFALLAWKNKWRYLYAGVLGGSVIGVSFFTDWARGFLLFQKVMNAPTSSRLVLWAHAWKEFLHAPLIGNGPHSLRYHEGIAGRYAPWAHNLYVEMLAEQGVLGFMVFVLLLVYGMKIAWETQRHQDQSVQIFGAGIVASLVGFCLASVFEISFIRQWAVVMLFIILGLILHFSSLTIGTRKRSEKCFVTTK